MGGPWTAEAIQRQAQSGRRQYVKDCVLALRQALEIRRDPELMAEIRQYLRTEQARLLEDLDAL
jgi:Arc/MetJ family transcription regulator